MPKATRRPSRKPAQTSPTPGPFLQLAYSSDWTCHDWSPETMRRLTMPATKALPFVVAATTNDPLQRPVSYWAVEPTGNWKRDVSRGRKFAAMALTAMQADGNHSLIGSILHDIMKDAAARHCKDVPYDRRNPASWGFIQELSYLTNTLQTRT